MDKPDNVCVGCLIVPFFLTILLWLNSILNKICGFTLYSHYKKNNNYKLFGQSVFLLYPVSLQTHPFSTFDWFPQPK